MGRDRVGEARDRLTTFFAGLDEGGIIAAYLFGSQTTGAAHPESDVDVAVLVDFNDIPPGFARRILREGVRTYCADAMAERAFLRDTELNVSDLKPFLDRARKIKLASLAR